MKTKIIYAFIAAFCLLWSCTPDNPDMDFEGLIDDPRIKVFDMEEDNSFMLVNGLKGEILPPKWDLGNGQTSVGDTVYAQYAFAGMYTITMTGFDGEKEVTVTKDIRIIQDNMALVSDPVYQFLTGGVEMPEGKTWVLDSMQTGHVRLWRRQTGQESNDQKPPLNYAGTGMYDDELTFKLMGSECIYENHGKSYSHGGTIDGTEFYRIEELKQMGSVSGYVASPRGDYIVDYTPAQNPQKWSLLKRAEMVNEVEIERYYLKLTGGAFMFFYRGNSPSDIEYRIDSISDNYMRVSQAETSPASRATARWETHFILVPKGTELKSETPADPEPPKEDEISEGFENDSKSLTFTYFDSSQTGWLGLPSFSVVRNVSMTGINPSDSIGRFVRGSGYDEYLRIQRATAIDLSEKNKLKMQVYMPATNNYLGVNLNPTVEVRLLNSRNTAEVVAKTNTVADTDFNKWIELTFDFSDQSAVKTYDTWIIQFGGQFPKGTNASPGIFYFDNLLLTK